MSLPISDLNGGVFYPNIMASAEQLPPDARQRLTTIFQEVAQEVRIPQEPRTDKQRDIKTLHEKFVAIDAVFKDRTQSSLALADKKLALLTTLSENRPDDIVSIEKCDEFLAAARVVHDEWIKEKKHWLSTLFMNGSAFRSAPDSIRRDKDLMLAAVRLDGWNLQYAHEDLKRDKEVVLAAVEKSCGVIQHVHPDMRKDKEIMFAAVRRYAPLLQYASEDIKRDKEFMLAAVKENHEVFSYANDDIKKDKEVAFAAIKKNGEVLKDLHEDLKRDKAFMLAIVRHNAHLIQYANDDMKNDKDVMLAAVRQNGIALLYANDNMKKDKEVVLAAVEQNGLTLRSAHDDLKKDKEIVLAAVRQYAQALQYAHDDLKKDKEVVFAAVEKNGLTLEYAHEDLQKDKEIVLAAIRQNENALQYADDIMKKDKTVVLAAIEQNGWAIRYAHDDLKKDKEIVLVAVRKSGYALDGVSDDLKKDKGVVLAAVGQYGEALEYAHESMKKDKEVVLAAVRQNGSALASASNDMKKDKDVVLAAVGQSGGALLFAHDDMKKDKEVLRTAIRQNIAAFEFVPPDMKNDKEIFLTAYTKDATAFPALRPISKAFPLLEPMGIWRVREFLLSRSMEGSEDHIRNAIDDYIKKEWGPHTFAKELGAINLIKDPYARQQSLSCFVEALVIIRQYLDADARDWVVKNNFLSAILAVRKPELRRLLVSSLVKIAGSPVNREIFESLPPSPNNETKRTWLLLVRLASAQLVNSGVDREDVKRFRAQVERGVFLNDNMKAAVLVETLYKLIDDETLTMDEKRELLGRIQADSKNGRAVYEDISAILAVINMGRSDALREAKPAKETMQKCFTEMVPGGDVDDFFTKYTDTFGSSRLPSAIFTYAGKMRSLNDPKVMSCLGEFVNTVLTGKFIENRYATDRNFHLKTVLESRKDSESFLKQWTQGVEKDLELEKAEAVSGVAGFTGSSPFQWLTMKLIDDKHVDLTNLPFLREFLLAPEAARKGVQDELNRAAKNAALQKVGSSDEQYRLRLQQDCLKLCLCDIQDVKGQQTILEGLRKLVNKGILSEQEKTVFTNDIVGRIKDLGEGAQPRRTSAFVAVDTDDPFDLLLCGTEVSGSCQNVTGTPDLNKGLLGYLMDGKIRLLAVKDKATGVIITRTMMKLEWDAVGKHPVIFLERFYGDNPEHQKALIDLAKEKARMLGGGIPTLNQAVGGAPYDRSLQALGGPAPFEYTDSGGGCCADGRYVITNVNVV